MNRRQWIQSAFAGSLSIATSNSLGQAIKPSRVIDTHTHFYDPRRPQGVPWPKENTPLYRTVLPPDWMALAEPLGIRETIVVEASPWVEDNQWILDLASNHACIIGFVGNLDPNDPAFRSNLKRFSATPIFRGVRWRGDLVKLDASQDQVLSGARSLAEHDLELDLNGPSSTLPQVEKLAQAIPSLRIVINHVGGAGDPQKLKPEWQAHIQAVAQCPNVFMKVSGMPEQTRPEDGNTPQDLSYYLPVLEHLWSHFGPDRLIYGSNWPVSDRGLPYASVFKLVSDFFQSKGAEATEKYFWRNSQTAYRWKERT
ncbi:Predicted metal-dependent hydrolase, TIM-barrel fold [Prosthecobacter debontii]|uniref:Predicted metal-dependent hydrolase, TIM-barrel fold n=1 Tax=Prosthecobacter debontii TaxID=48467 RepID=A0A1T4WE01_9BACT|nr:amidohydrolase family protein [Prosthecobacter debontii]SKA75552.1 Predicted metal-dependent hydrolase, TIM-barrel fold [Prosthecobacter debontii]